MKKLLIGITTFIGALLLFTGGVFASQWLNFTGDEAVSQSSNDVSEIMEILRNLNDDKLSAEEALAELEALNLPELVEQLEGTIELRDNTIAGLEEQLSNAGDPEYILHLEEELQRANDSVEQHNTVTTEAVEEARSYGGSN